MDFRMLKMKYAIAQQKHLYSVTKYWHEVYLKNFSHPDVKDVFWEDIYAYNEYDFFMQLDVLQSMLNRNIFLDYIEIIDY